MNNRIRVVPRIYYLLNRFVLNCGLVLRLLRWHRIAQIELPAFEPLAKFPKTAFAWVVPWILLDLKAIDRCSNASRTTQVPCALFLSTPQPCPPIFSWFS